MSQRINHQWRLISRPVGNLTEANFQWTEETVPELQDGQVLVRALYLSLDPANRGWVREGGSYRDEIPLGAVMEGGGVGVIEESKNPNFNVGETVQGMFGWQEYVVSDGRGVSKLPDRPGLPLTAYLGLFGHIGLTAYFGLLDICNPQPGETLVVSAAAGAVGSLVGQIGKIKGCRVVGIAGSDDKCKWIVEELGFDAAINYKTEKVSAALRRACPNGIDIDFENVGGEIFDAILGQINLGARISVCGLISQYNATAPVPGPYNLVNILAKRAKVQGFIVTDYMPRAQEAMKDLGEWFMQGKLKYRVEVVEGLQSAPTALNKLFEGSNQGKLIIKL
ncbi:MAG: NADP-dependent oxidoreductase [Acidobacteria bacterium]|nr:NADP-dependent oxidoreductase [Acidobacteriota bacterium]MBI3424286.1 NADP-dependent oxidoreductase [Acidobacteriota bacterium]